MAKHLKQFGWQYVVIDEGWYVTNPGAKPEDVKFSLDDNGRFIPVVDRFPSAADGAGFKPLADYVHSLGLKFGIHILRGIPREAVAQNLRIAVSPYTASEAAVTDDTCPWNTFMYGVQNAPPGQAYYNSIFQLYASWGVDFVKADCISDHPYKPDDMLMMHFALRQTNRDIVLSLSPGPTALDKADEVAPYAEMWRIADDFWDHWGPLPDKDKAWSQGVLAQFGWTAKWAAYHQPGRWPDADMLPLGRIGPHPGDGGPPRNTNLTHDEQVTMMTLWSIFRSPLILGGELPSSDEWTTKLLTNPEVLAVDQHSKDHRPVYLDGDRSCLDGDARRRPRVLCRGFQPRRQRADPDLRLDQARPAQVELPGARPLEFTGPGQRGGLEGHASAPCSSALPRRQQTVRIGPVRMIS